MIIGFPRIVEVGKGYMFSNASNTYVDNLDDLTEAHLEQALENYIIGLERYDRLAEARHVDSLLGTDWVHYTLESMKGTFLFLKNGGK